MTDRSYRWVVLAYTLALQAVALGALLYCFALFAKEWIETFAAARAEVMLTISLLQIVVGLISPWAGRLVDRLPPQRIVLAGIVAYGLSFMALSQASALWQVYLVFATLAPLSISLMGTIVSQVLVTRWFHERRGLALGLSAMGSNLGGIVFPLTVGALLVNLPWRDVAWVLAAVGVAVTLPLTLWVLRRELPDLPGSGGVAQPVDNALTLRTLLPDARFWVPVSGLVPITLSFGALQFNLAVLAEDRGLGDAASAYVALSAACMLGGKLLFGFLGDRVDHRYLFWFAQGTMVATLMLLLNAQSALLFSAAVVALGVAGGSILPLMGSVMSARFELAVFGRVMGFVMLTISLASLGPILAGGAYDATGSYRLAFVFFAVLLIMGGLVIVRLPPARQEG